MSVDQPLGFINSTFPDHVLKLKKDLYYLKQAPRVRYNLLSKFLLKIKFERGKADKTLFIKRTEHEILLVQNYVDDIIFGATNKSLYKDFYEMM